MVVVYIIYTTFTVLHGYIDIHGGMAYIIISVFSLVFFTKILNDKIYIYIIIYSVIIMIYSAYGRNSYSYVYSISEIFQFLSVILIGMIFISRKIYHQYYIYASLVSILIVLIMSVTSISQLIDNPNVIRYLSLTDLDEEYKKQLYRSWVGSYSMVHGIVPLFPLFVFVLKSNKIYYRKKVYIGSVFFILLVFMILSNATTPLLLTILGIIISIIVNNKSVYLNIYKISIVIFAALVLLFYMDMFISGLLSIQNYLSPESSNYRKINMIVDSGLPSYRKELYNLSLHTIYEYPLFGSNNYNNTGKHSFILDKIAVMGIVNTGIFLAFVILYMNYMAKHIYEAKIYYYISVIMYMIMIISKNIISYEMIIYPLLIVPGLYLAIDYYLINDNKYDRFYKKAHQTYS